MKLQELKEKAIKENNAMIYKAIQHFEKYGNINAVFEALYEQTQVVKKMEFMINNGLGWNDLYDDTLNDRQ